MMLPYRSECNEESSKCRDLLAAAVMMVIHVVGGEE